MALAFSGRALFLLLSSIAVNSTLASTISTPQQGSSSKTFKAQYSVPVTSDSLKPYATFDIAAYTVDTAADGTTSLHFNLPDDLAAGETINVHFVETQKTATERILVGKSGIVRCTIPWLGSQCSVEFDPRIVPDFSKTVDHILKKYPLGDGWVDRLDVLNRFGTEPIGRVKVLELVNQNQ